MDDIPEPAGNLLSIFVCSNENYSSNENEENKNDIKTKSKKRARKPCNSSSESLSDSSDYSIEVLNKSFNELSTDIERQRVLKKAKTIKENKLDINDNKENKIDIQIFEKALPRWGGWLVINEKNLDIKITNTCTVDNFLLAIWTSSKLNSQILHNISSLATSNKNHILEIIDCIDKNNWNEAKSNWIIKVLNLKPKCECVCEDPDCDESDCKPECECVYVSECESKEISLFGSEYEFL